MPDEQHYDSTVENFEASGASEFDAVWSLENVPVASVDPLQLIDDPTDETARTKVRSIQQAIRQDTFLPPVYVLHVRRAFPYFLIEGRHRYSAAHEEQIPLLLAWVAHVECVCPPHEDEGDIS
ncbi:ParB N-terminal domain-containing protein [Knoellia subterranea]|nr:ParB N-terminal domain-containing protein [Knoellia subterranea]